MNRDDAIDRLLRNAFGGEKSPGASGACIKAELAAAWADGALSGRERSAIQAHAADCLECQALLSALARSARLPPSTPERRPHLVWLVPLTTVVAAAFVWAVVVRTPRSPVSMEQTARVIEPALPRPQEPVARQRLDQSTSPRPAGTPAETKTRDASNGLQATAANAQKGRLRVDGVASDAPTGSSSASGGDARETPQRIGGSVAGLSSESLAVQAAPAGASSALAKQLEAAAELAKATAPPTARSDSLKTDPRATSLVRWRLDAGGNIERSVDGGSSWQTQMTGATQTMAAVSSPSPNVCWAAGAHGTVLLTIDGRTWQQVGSPDRGDLIAIHAADDETATVTAADGRSFSTTDRGITWMAVAGRQKH